MNIIHKQGKLYLSYKYLESKGIPSATIWDWKQKRVCNVHSFDNRSFVVYDEIPKRSRQRLPEKVELIALVNLEQHNEKVDEYYRSLYYANTKGFIKHIDYYKEKYPSLTREKINEISKVHAVWEYIIELTVEGMNRDTSGLYRAFNKVYPNKYKSYNCFANTKKRAIDNGAEFVAVDKRLFTTPLNVKQVNVVNQFWVRGLISVGKKYSNRTVWEKLCKLCNESNETPPSLSWVDKYRKSLLDKNISVFDSRNGKDSTKAKQLPYASMKAALNANDQWQMDGWTLPFWVNNGTKFCRYIIVIVRDSYSKKIIGSAVGESENTLLIMAALKDAIINTGCLPFEILTDNHSFNQTKEADHFKEAIGKIGTQFTVSSNPQHKSIIERYNQHLDRLCREYHGYIGEGIKSKNIDARPKQELIDEYAKNQLSVNEIMLIGIKIVTDFNENVLPKENKSPNTLYAESEAPNCFKVDVFDRIKILTARTEIKINRGQLNIKRGNTKYEYQLPANLYHEYNNKVVTIRYEELNECVYLYDNVTDEPITELSQKPKIHGAKANQTDVDIELLNKNKGRIVGIKSKAKKDNEHLTATALKANPDAFMLLNKVTTQKNVLKDFEQNSNLKRIASDKGIDLTRVHIPVRENELDNESLQPKEINKDSPFTPKNHQIKKVSLNDFNEE